LNVVLVSHMDEVLKQALLPGQAPTPIEPSNPDAQTA